MNGLISIKLVLPADFIYSLIRPCDSLLETHTCELNIIVNGTESSSNRKWLPFTHDGDESSDNIVNTTQCGIYKWSVSDNMHINSFSLTSQTDCQNGILRLPSFSAHCHLQGHLFARLQHVHINGYHWPWPTCCINKQLELFSIH